MVMKFNISFSTEHTTDRIKKITIEFYHTAELTFMVWSVILRNSVKERIERQKGEQIFNTSIIV